MKISVEISLYPLKEDFVPVILDFINRINRHSELVIKTNSMSTQIFGDYAKVMQALNEEIEASFLSSPHLVFTMKIINADLTA